MNKEEVLKLAKENGATESTAGLVLYQSKLLAFANACEKIGMEKAVKICDALHGERNGDCAEAIRAAT